MNMSVSIAFHIIGFVLWVGGTMFLSRALAVAVGDVGAGEVKRWGWRAFCGYLLPGALLTVITGLYQIAIGGGVAFYFAQGWFHGKLTLVLLMLGATVMLGIKTKVLSEGTQVGRGTFMAIHGIAALVLVGAIILTITGRVGMLGR